MLTKAGAKLLDFGLAKATAASRPRRPRARRPQSPTQPKPLTAEGTHPRHLPVHGARAARGQGGRRAHRHLRARAPCSTRWRRGQAAFAGTTQAIADRGDPAGRAAADLAALQPLTPPALDRVVKACLAKDPEDRWQTARDVASELRWIAEGSAAGAARRRRRRVAAKARARGRVGRGRWRSSRSRAGVAGYRLRRPRPGAGATGACGSLLPPERTASV